MTDGQRIWPHCDLLFLSLQRTAPPPTSAHPPGLVAGWGCGISPYPLRPCRFTERILLSSSSRQALMTFFMIMFGMRCVCSSSIPVKGEVALPKLNQASIVARSYVLPSAEVVSGWPVSDAMAWRRHCNQQLLASGTIVVNGWVVTGSAFSLQGS